MTLAGFSGSSGTASSSVSPSAASCSASRRASSSSSNPIKPRLKSSSFSAASSLPRSSSSHPAFRASWLSAMMYARFCASAQVIQDNYRYFLELQLARGEQAAMAGDDASLGIHQNRVVEPEGHDAGGDLSDLGIGVGSGIPGKRNEPIQRPQLDVLCHW